MSLLDRIRSEGAAASIDDDAATTPDVEQLLSLVRAAGEAIETDERAALAAWDTAGTLHDLETLDIALQSLGTGRGIFGGGRRTRRVVAATRHALARSERVGTVQLAAAVLGQMGDSSDVPALEVLAVHPGLNLHAATALAVHPHRSGVAALLRVLAKTSGEQRLTVIDRLLVHAEQPAVRLALVRDALVGLDSELAREVAPDIAARCDIDAALRDPKTADDVRAGAELVRLYGG